MVVVGGKKIGEKVGRQAEVMLRADSTRLRVRSGVLRSVDFCSFGYCWRGKGKKGCLLVASSVLLGESSTAARGNQGSVDLAFSFAMGRRSDH